MLEPDTVREVDEDDMTREWTPEEKVRAVQMGRTSFRPEIGDQLVTAYKVTPSLKGSCAVVGVPYSTCRRWLAMGADGDPRFSEWYLAMTTAAASHEDGWLKNLEEIASQTETNATASLRANIFLLQKFFPTQYADHRQVDVNVNETKSYDFSRLSIEQKKLLLSALNDPEEEEDTEEDADIIDA